jgi:hypothetical protein
MVDSHCIDGLGSSLIGPRLKMGPPNLGPPALSKRAKKKKTTMMMSNTQ